jgi:hypothetical protein
MRGCGYRPGSAGARPAQWWPEGEVRSGEASKSDGEGGAQPAIMLCSCSAMAVTRPRDRGETEGENWRTREERALGLGRGGA